MRFKFYDQSYNRLKTTAKLFILIFSTHRGSTRLRTGNHQPIPLFYKGCHRQAGLKVLSNVKGYYQNEVQ